MVRKAAQPSISAEGKPTEKTENKHEVTEIKITHDR